MAHSYFVATSTLKNSTESLHLTHIIICIHVCKISEKIISSQCEPLAIVVITRTFLEHLFGFITMLHKMRSIENPLEIALVGRIRRKSNGNHENENREKIKFHALTKGSKLDDFALIFTDWINGFDA